MLKKPLPFDTIFCPHCHRLVLDGEACPNGDWKRPERTGELGKLVWQRTLEGDIGKPYLTLNATAQLLFVAVEKGEQRYDRNSELIALDIQTGITRWTHPFPPNRFARFLTLTANLLISSSEHLGVLAGAQCTVQALDVLTGKPKWQTDLPAHSHSAPAVLDSLLIISASDHHVYALNVTTGEIVWRSSELPSWSPAPPVIGEKVAFIGGFTHVISYLTPEGANAPLFTNTNETSWFDIPFAYENGILYAASSDRQLYAIDTNNGVLKWSQPAERGASASPVIAENQIFLPLKARGRGRYLLRALSRFAGDTQWEFVTHKHILAPPIFHDGNLYFGSRAGKFYALNAATGDLCWEFESGEEVRSTAVINGNYLFFGAADGTIYCLRWQEETQEPLLPAQEYRADGEWLLAGTAAALDGQWLDAAEDLERASYPGVAAQLYERAKAWHKAAPLYAEANHLQSALNAFEQIGDKRNMAEIYMQLRQPDSAADLFAELGDHVRAATIYHETGHLRRAAKQYALSGYTEQAVKLFLALKQPESAAQVAAEAGDINKAVAILVEIDEFERAAMLLVTNDRRVTGVNLLESNGYIHAAANLWSTVGEMEKAAQVFDRANLWEDAANCYEEAGLTVKAAEAYFLAGEARKAADLYMEAGNLQNALAIFVQLNSYRSIAKIYERQEQWHAAAQAYLAANPPRYEKAAGCFVKVKAWAQAAQAFQDAGFIDAAVDNWRKSETPRKGAELLRAQGRKSEAAELFFDIGMLQDAAEIDLELGNIQTAVNRYRQLGNQERAVQIARDYQRWDIISQMARESGDYEQEAEAALALARQSPGEDYLHYRAAAHAYVRTAQQEEARADRLIADDAIASLWDLAARYFDEGMVEDKKLIIQSQRQARRIRGWPEIVVEVQVERKLAINRWDGLFVNVKNIGFGVARHVSTKVIPGEFEGKLDTQIFSGILPGRTERRRINVRPRSAGSAVPLYIRITYMRSDQEIVERDISAEVHVHDYDSKSATSESQIGRRKPIKLHRDEDYEDDGRAMNIIVQGDYITVGNISDATVAIGESSSADATDIVSQQIGASLTPAQLTAALSALSEKIDANFTLAEINSLAGSLNVDETNLAGTVKLEKAYALADQLLRVGHLEWLFTLLETQRPDVPVSWRAGFE